MGSILTVDFLSLFCVKKHKLWLVRKSLFKFNFKKKNELCVFLYLSDLFIIIGRKKNTDADGDAAVPRPLHFLQTRYFYTRCYILNMGSSFSCGSHRVEAVGVF